MARPFFLATGAVLAYQLALGVLPLPCILRPSARCWPLRLQSRPGTVRNRSDPDNNPFVADLLNTGLHETSLEFPPCSMTLQLLRTAPGVWFQMTDKKLNEGHSRRIYQAYEKEALDEFLDLCMTEDQLKETIAYLIERRQELKDEEIKKLEQESQDLIRRLKQINQKKSIEEIKSFKDILALHKRLLENGKRD